MGGWEIGIRESAEERDDEDTCDMAIHHLLLRPVHHGPSLDPLLHCAPHQGGLCRCAGEARRRRVGGGRPCGLQMEA
jgi:hypothetical protein